jgi:hypothetical protein
MGSEVALIIVIAAVFLAAGIALIVFGIRGLVIKKGVVRSILFLFLGLVIVLFVGLKLSVAMPVLLAHPAP